MRGRLPTEDRLEKIEAELLLLKGSQETALKVLRDLLQHLDELQQQLISLGGEVPRRDLNDGQ